MNHTDTTLPAEAHAQRHPSRRRLLALLAGVPLFSAKPSRTEAGVTDATPDIIPVLHETFQRLKTEHQRVVRQCDRLETSLRAELELPRVQLPRQAGEPVRYAADVATIIRYVPPGWRRSRLQAVLLQRQEAWERGSEVCGLSRVQAREAALNQAVREAVATLLATPTVTPTGIQLKLLALLATQEPGPAFRDTSPWRELRIIQEDLDKLANS
ncbi:hypothetical protein [Methylobacterium iners]|uniref:Tat pathway signal protein n=1 Tax=Methylobacterium iners TaxID=418707 RepID=A0ABQ4RQT9_9HYPH|nr:hypothetical protein [Methylobacterium iners]GJD93131.1 hypothetical protein OCOJLMKI_0321 [Methylobacterium iners]